MTLDDDLLQMIQRAVEPGESIFTLGQDRENRVIEISAGGVIVETDHSDDHGKGPQLVPAKMIADAWNRLSQTRELSRQDLESLNIKRTAFIFALLARFEGVEQVDTRPITLRLAAKA